MSSTPTKEQEELREQTESILMHFCELATAGDPEKELQRATTLIEALIRSEVTSVLDRLDETRNGYVYLRKAIEAERQRYAD